MNSKTKILSLFVTGTATLSPFNEIKASEISHPNAENIVLKDGKSSLSQAENFIHADKSSEKSFFDKERFMDKTNATSEEINKIESDLQATNYDIKNTKNIKYENGKFVRYVNSEEENEMLAEQGLKANDNTENNSTVTTFAAKKGGVTAAATAIGGLSAGIDAAVAGAFASQLINAYAGKAVPKNGIIMYGKPHGSEYITFAPQ